MVIPGVPADAVQQTARREDVAPQPGGGTAVTRVTGALETGPAGSGPGAPRAAGAGVAGAGAAGAGAAGADGIWTGRRPARLIARSLFLLTKPRIIELLLVTTLPTMLLAERGLPSVR